MPGNCPSTSAVFGILILLLLILAPVTAQPAPVAKFNADRTYGPAPLTVTFEDQSTGNPSGWAWYFGDENFTREWTAMNTSAGWSERASHASVVMQDGSIVLMGGFLLGYNQYDTWNDVWRSTDNGRTWILVNPSAGWTARFGHSSVAMPDNSIVLMGGSGAVDIWRSTDNGARWTRMNASVPIMGDSSSVAMPDGSIVLMGGADGNNYQNYVRRSTDNGAHWTLVNTSAPWGARYGHRSVTMPDASIILTGGAVNGIYMNDVWRSTDYGTTWMLMNASAPWEARAFHSCVAMPDGSIVLIGGNDRNAVLKNDVWRSTDNGATWNLVTAHAGWSARLFFSSVAMPDGSLIVMGGSSHHGYLNDVWRIQTAGSAAQNPSHTYTTPGIYQVALQTYNADGYNSTRKTGYIIVESGILPLPGCTSLPTDPDHDGLYEDLNGNGRLDFADVVLYFTQMEWIAANEPVSAFDLNGNGRIDFADIVMLFGEI